MSVKPEMYTADRDKAVNKSRDSGVWSNVINIYTENSKHLSKEHHHHQEGQRRAQATQKS